MSPKSPQKRKTIRRKDKPKVTPPKGKTAKDEDSSPSRNSGGFFAGLLSAAQKDTGNFIVGVVLFVLTAVCFLACFSYLFTAQYDQSIIMMSHDEVSAEDLDHQQVRNLFSYIGARVSHVLVHGFLGIGIFALLAFPFLLSLRLIGVHPRLNIAKSFIRYTLLAITISLFAYLVTLPFRESLIFEWGGLHGEAVGKQVILYLGIWGLVFLVILLGIICWVLFQPKRKDNIRFLLSLNWMKRMRRKKYPKDSGEGESLVSESESLKEDETEGVDTSDYSSDIPSTAPEDDLSLDDVTSGLTSMEEVEASGKSDSSLSEDVSSIGESQLVVEVANPGPQSSPEDRQFAQARDRIDQGDLHDYQFPVADLLNLDDGELDKADMAEIHANEQMIINTLDSFKIKVTPIKATVGPTVTLYEIEPDAGIKISRIRNLEDDIALSLKAEGIRIIAPIPGKGTIGIEVPNAKPKMVRLRSLLTSRKFVETKFELPVALGRTVTNEVFAFDLTKMPHLLIAGATGQGKSVGMNVIITSLLYAKHPSELKFVMIDPKILEFSVYNDLERHFFAKIPTEDKCIITDTDKVVPTLLSLCEEMDNRYLLLTKAKVRNIAEYNKAYREGKLDNDESKLMPYIVLVVDEFADLIMTGGKEIERPIARLAQKARAAGIHMILATQRPTTDVVTGTIKANFPARIAFKVFSAVDSRTILDSTGANRLIGRGDLLFYQGRDMIRLQCALVETEETERIVDFISQQTGYSEPYPLPIPSEDENKDVPLFSDDKLDTLFETVARAVVSSGQGSTSKIQRDFEIGFNRAGRLMDQLERAGIVGKQYGSKPREVLVQDLDTLNQIFYQIRMSSK